MIYFFCHQLFRHLSWCVYALRLDERPNTLAYLGVVSVRWLTVDGHSVDGHYVVCHSGRITIRNDSYVARLLGRVVIENPIQM